MKLLLINNLSKSGINSDIMPCDLPPDFITDGQNIRMVANKIKSHEGWSFIANLPDTFEPGMILYVNAAENDYWLIAGLDAVYIYNGSTFTDISEPSGYSSVSDEKLWTGCFLSTVPIINNPGKVPEYWSPQTLSQDLVKLPWDATRTWDHVDVNQSCRLIRSHKQFLFALDLNDNGTEIPDGVRWSAPADITGVPDSWDNLDTTNVAGLTTLGGKGGRIVDGLSLKDSFVVYREDAITVFDYVQGSPYVWQIRNLTTAYGLLNKNCIREVSGAHYFIGSYDILKNDGTQVVSLLHDRLKVKFRETLDPNNFNLSFAVKNDSKSEIWFCIPVKGNVGGYSAPFNAFIYNWLDNSWAVVDLPNGGILSADYGVDAEPEITWASTSPNPWSSYQDAWSSGGISPFGEAILGIQGPSQSGETYGKIFALDRFDTDLDGVPRYSFIERTGLSIGGLSRVTTITRIYPRMDENSSCYIQVGSQDYPGSPVRWKNPVEFDSSRDRKIDVKTTGELHCYRIYTDETGYFSISGMEVEYAEAGAR